MYDICGISTLSKSHLIFHFLSKQITVQSLVVLTSSEDEADLFMKPGRPFVGDKLIIKIKLLCHVRQESLHLRRHVILDEPYFDAIPACRRLG